jgi:hypothetical protein
MLKVVEFAPDINVILVQGVVFSGGHFIASTTPQ